MRLGKPRDLRYDAVAGFGSLSEKLGDIVVDSGAPPPLDSVLAYHYGM